MPVQSPIAICLRSLDYKDEFPPLEFHGHFDSAGSATIENTGTSAMIRFANRDGQPYLSGGPLKNNYIFEQLHFHWADNDLYGCEHHLEDNKFSMEAHAVHYNSKYKDFTEAVSKYDGLAVTAFFIQAHGNVDCPEFNKVTDGIKKVCRPNTKSSIDSNCLSWIGHQEISKHYYSYRGSLTTFPYFESVIWIIYRSPIYVSSEQVSAFRNLKSDDHTKNILNNNRPVQKPTKKPDVYFVRNIAKLKSKM